MPFPATGLHSSLGIVNYRELLLWLNPAEKKPRPVLERKVLEGDGGPMSMEALKTSILGARCRYFFYYPGCIVILGLDETLMN